MKDFAVSANLLKVSKYLLNSVLKTHFEYFYILISAFLSKGKLSISETFPDSKLFLQGVKSQIQLLHKKVRRYCTFVPFFFIDNSGPEFHVD